MTRTIASLAAIVAALASSLSFAQWKLTDGPVTITAFDTIPSGVIAATSDGRVYVETNNGGWRWKLIRANNTMSAINALAIIDSTILAGTGNGIYRYDNAGSWTRVGPVTGNAIIRCFAKMGTLVIAGSSAGMFRSSGNGTSWERIAPNLTNRATTSLLATGNKVYAAIDSAGIFRSLDTGKTWTAFNTGISASVKIRAIVSMIDGYLVAGTASNGFLFSDSGSANWLPFTKTYMPEQFSVNALTKGLNSLYAATDAGVFVFNSRWSVMDSGMKDIGAHALFVSKGNRVYAGTSAGVFLKSITDPLVPWSLSDSGMSDSLRVNRLTASGSMIYSTMGGGGWCNVMVLSADNGRTWDSFDTSGGCFPIRSVTVYKQSLFVGLQSLSGQISSGGGVYKFTDNNSRLSFSGLLGETINCLATDGTILLAGCQADAHFRGGLWRSANWTDWTSFDSVLRSPSNYPPSISALKWHGSTLFASTGSGVIRTVDNGVSWTMADSGLSGSHVRMFETCGTTIFALSDSCIFRLLNNGASWIRAMTGMPDDSLTSLTSSGQNVFAGTGHSGVYRSTDLGAEWSAFNFGLPVHAPVYSLCASDSFLFAGAGGRVWRFSVPVVSTSGQSGTGRNGSHVVGSLKIQGQRNDRLMVSFSLSREERIEILIVDLAGNQIAPVTRSLKGAGQHSVEFNTGAIAPGCYFLILKTAKSVTARKFSLTGK